MASGWTVGGAAEDERARSRGGRRAPVGQAAASRPAPSRAQPRKSPARKDKLSKEAYRRGKAAADGELTRLGLRRSHLELALSDPAVQANFVEMRRVTSELADIDVALAAAEDAWLEVEERAP